MSLSPLSNQIDLCTFKDQWGESLLVHSALETEFPDINSSSIIDYSVPGNRLYEKADGSIGLAPKPLGYVIGEQVVAPAIDAIVSISKNLFSLIGKSFTFLDRGLSSLYQFQILPGAAAEEIPIELVRSEQVERVPAPRSSCSDAILRKFPGISENAQQIVITLCSNEDQVLSYCDNEVFSIEELQAIGEALGQNTALKKLTMKEWQTDGDQVKAMAPLIMALRKNKTLKSLLITGGGNEFTTPAETIFLENLCCFHLNEINFYPMHSFADSSARALKQAISSPHLTISNVTFPYWDSLDGFKETMSGLALSECLSAVSLNAVEQFDQTNIFMSAIKTAKALSNITIYSADHVNTTVALDSIQTNKCITQVNLQGNWDPSFIEAVRNITEGRIPCQRSSSCDIPATDCPSPPQPPSPAESTSTLPPVAWVFIGAGGTLVVVAATAGGIALGFTYNRRRKKQLGETSPLVN